MIDLDHVILDELHLLLRVTDVLTNSLLEDVLEWDKREETKKKTEIRGIHLQGLVVLVLTFGKSVMQMVRDLGCMISLACLEMTKRNY